MLRRSLLILSLVLLASIPGVAHAQYGGDSADITLTGEDGDQTSTFTPGEDGTANLSGMTPNTTHDLDFAQSPGEIVGSGTSDADGDLTINFTIPSDASNGSATLTFDPRGVSGANATTTIQISGAAAGDGGALPDTGSSIDLFVGSGIVLIGVGAVLVLSVRKRRARRLSGTYGAS